MFNKLPLERIQWVYETGCFSATDLNAMEKYVWKLLRTWLLSSAVDFPLRQRLAQAGMSFVTESGLLEWSHRGARIVSYLTGKEHWLAADFLVFAGANVAADSLARELREAPFDVIAIGDSLAPRQAPMAIYEGRKAALEL